MLESEVAKIGDGFSPFFALSFARRAQCLRIRIATAVFPVPGGPEKVKRANALSNNIMLKITKH
jgi:hypothetical protein